MSHRYLLCTDLDRTLLPNGAQAEQPGSRKAFAALVSDPSICLAYVTGRHRELVLQAIGDFELPSPHYVIASVGTEIFSLHDGEWSLDETWQRKLLAVAGPDFARSVREALGGLPGIREQEGRKQKSFKRSFYTAGSASATRKLLQEAGERLQQAGVDAVLIWSVDETSATGLLDVLPGSAGKLAAIEYLLRISGITAARAFFAGDSGNDLDVICSALKSVLVANASDEVRREALRRATANGTIDALYLAGVSGGASGNYSAGIVEGFHHYFKEFAPLRERPTAAGTRT